MDYSRRRFAMLAASLGALESCKREEAAPKAAKNTKKLEHLASRAYQFEDLPVKLNQKTQSTSRAILEGLTHRDYAVEVHETELPPGASPHPPHHHVHEEMFLVRSGLLDATVNGATTRIDAGSVFYVNSNEEHGVVNPGPERASYFVIALGRES